MNNCFTSCGRNVEPAQPHWPTVARALAGAALLAGLTHGEARAQLLERYFPANVPAYQDWFANLDTSGTGDAYTPLGVRAGSFIIRPSITEGIGYDSNVIGTQAALGSAELRSSGAVNVDSDWSRNSLNASVAADDMRYFDAPGRSFTTWTASAGGTIDYADDKIGLGYAHLNTVSLPTDAGTFGLLQPVTGQVDDVRISDTLGPGPLILVPALDGQLYRFSTASGATSAASQGLFNRDQLTGSVTASYEFAGGHNVIVVLNDSDVTYSGAPTGRPANYNDASILAGLEYRQSALFVYRALVGYEERFPNGRGTGRTISAPAAELDLIWTPTRLLSLTGRVVQSLQNEVTAAGQGVTDTSGQLILDYAARRNVMLEGTLRYDRTSFSMGEGTQSAFIASAEARWNLNRNLGLVLHYDFTKGDDSSDSALSFTRQQILLQARFQM
jgi:hypothetical protein